jgi:hypothetical protein
MQTATSPGGTDRERMFSDETLDFVGRHRDAFEIAAMELDEGIGL